MEEDISSLCQALVSLEVLDLTNNTMENDIVESPSLKNIHVLVLNNCSVTWELDVRLSGNPIADPAKGGSSGFVLVSRLGKVKILNGSEVSPREWKEAAREWKEAEIRFGRAVMRKAESNYPEEIKRLHPRFAELKAIHGIEDEKPTSRTSGLQKMASGLSIALKCVGPSMGEKQPLTKKLPPTTTRCPVPQLLEEDTASLMELGMGTGTTIIVDEES